MANSTTPSAPWTSEVLETVSLSAVPGLDGTWIVPVAGIAAPAQETPRVEPDPARQYVGADRAESLLALPPVPDELTACHGPGVYDRMRRSDGVIAASIRSVRVASVGHEGPSFSSRYPDPQGRPIDFRDPPEGATEDVVNAAKAAEACEWAASRLKTPAPRVSWALSRCYWEQNVVAEKVYDVSTDFDGKARIVPSDVRPKHWSQWAFVLDKFNNLDSILAAAVSPENGTEARYVRIAPETFLVAGFSQDGDSPVGDSVGQPCHPWWRLKLQIPRRANQWMALFSIPIPWIRLGPNTPPSQDDQGNPIPPERAAAITVTAIQAGSGFVLPNGADAGTLDVTEDATQFGQIAQLCDRQNVHTLTGTAGSSLEPERNAKAQASAMQDVADYVKLLVRMAVDMAWRDFCLDFLARNWGRDFAVSYCPVVSHGKADARDYAALADALGKLVAAGIVTNSQKQAALRTIMGWMLPEPPEDELNLGAQAPGNAPSPGEGQGATPGSRSGPGDSPSR